MLCISCPWYGRLSAYTLLRVALNAQVCDATGAL